MGTRVLTRFDLIGCPGNLATIRRQHDGTHRHLATGCGFMRGREGQFHADLARPVSVSLFVSCLKIRLVLREFFGHGFSHSETYERQMPG
ncbi:hypothetical protein GCM10007207_24600 [Asaia siamensis]|uniref:Uncharacterized protein n=1 Tax=Asaia siamensis TaxID=110479 RepID=A0ABQ1MFF9_9PROT|nr:hypothetical protein AA0323_0338 [Asaia siamensis NRIC 0323]GGC38119.1 hypothetical protein GCM10007207_24600 [Asaia siamensis]